ncbi:hypothetical protein IJE86_08245, partial [bacterium]|nr:hypothetical protein [bacterium]
SLYSNDIRHQYVSALYTRNLGANWAALLGEINEIFDFNMSGRNDTLTDRFNNNLGIEYGINYPNLPKNDLLQMLLNDFEKNKSLRLKNIDIKRKK